MKKLIYYMVLTAIVFCVVAYSYKNLRIDRDNVKKFKYEYLKFVELKSSYEQEANSLISQDHLTRIENIIQQNRLHEKMEYIENQKDYIRISFKNISQDEWIGLMNAMNNLQDVEIIKTQVAKSKNKLINFIVDLRQT